MRHHHLGRILVVLSASLLVLGLITVPASAAADAATGSMTGPVYGHLDPQTDTFPKLSGVVVTVLPANDENAPPVGTATTDATGRYRIDGIPPGDYKVHFAGNPDLYRPGWFGGDDSFATATPVTIYAGVLRDGVGTYLQDATTSIAGWVSGPYDAQIQTTTPVVGATVNLIPATDENANPVKVATTTADGSYSMTAVPPGQYKVRAAANDPLLGAPRWYGGATFAEAAIVTITPGTHLLWVYVFFDATSASISGTVNGPFNSGTVVSGGTVAVVPADDENADPVATGITAPDGTYVIRAIPPGRYKLLMAGDPTRYFSQWYGPLDGSFVNAYTFTIRAGVDNSNINVYLRDATISVSGWVGGYDVNRLPGVTVELVPASSDTAVPVAAATTGADGGYTVTGIPPGEYQVHFQADPLRYVPEWWRSGETLTLGRGDRPTEVIAILHDATSSLAGVVLDSGGDPLAGVTVDVFLGDDLVTPAATRTTGVDGTYRFEGLARGSYRVQFNAGPTYAVQWYPQTTNASQAWQIGNGPGFHVDDLSEVLLRPLNAPPTPTISGAAKVGSTLTANPGQWGPQPVGLKYQWTVGDDDIGDETDATFTLPDWTLGEKISVTVTGSKPGYLSLTRTSAPTAAVAVGTLTAPIPKIIGTAKVGSKLTATAGSWGPSPVTLKYQWRANNVNISGATATTYTVPATMYGKRIGVTVSGTKEDYASASVTSAQTAGVAAGTLVAPTPKVIGTMKVGHRLTAVAGSWGPSPVTMRYQWKANNVNISGATASTYALPGTLKGKRITVTVTGSKAGYASAPKTSAASVPVAAGTLTAATPKITGTAKVGARLSASVGTWGPAPVTIKYQWKINGAGISGASRSTYVITASAKGKRITVTVTGSKTGFTSLARTSAATATVK